MAPIASPGNDTIIPGDSGDTLYGDPFAENPLSTGRGGNDLLSATGDYNWLSATPTKCPATPAAATTS